MVDLAMAWPGDTLLQRDGASVLFHRYDGEYWLVHTDCPNRFQDGSANSCGTDSPCDIIRNLTQERRMQPKPFRRPTDLDYLSGVEVRRRTGEWADLLCKLKGAK